jgi:hypothetical protein
MIIMDTAIMPVVASDNAVGRPGKYETHVLPRIQEVEQWVKEGYTDYSIADNLGISPTTLIEYKKDRCEIIEAYQRARTHRNNLVMNKMFQKATGEKVVLNKQKLDKYGDVHDLIEEMYIPPDVNAADLFLRNNDPDYKGPKAVESGNITINNFQLPEKLKEIEQLDKAISDLEKQLAVDVEVIPIE